MILFILSFSTSAFGVVGVKGQISSPKDCGPKVMVWLSLDKDDYKERLLLMHSEVPVGGSFQFYLKPGSYQLRASDEKGCDFYKRIEIGQNLKDVAVTMVKR